jgi:hypothetical protein
MRNGSRVAAVGEAVWGTVIGSFPFYLDKRLERMARV